MACPVSLKCGVGQDAIHSIPLLFTYVWNKRKNRKGVSLLHGWCGEILMGDKEKAKRLDTYFTSVFSHKKNNAQPGVGRKKIEGTVAYDR